MITFLIVGLVPTIICILYPPQLAIIEKAAPEGVHVGLNNWYTTRDYPSSDIPERLLQKVKSKNTFTNEVQIQQDNQTLIIQTTNAQQVKLLQLYNLAGTHKQTTYLPNQQNRIDIQNLNSGEYLILIEANGTVYLKEITIL